jgi:hypothetical protein
MDPWKWVAPGFPVLTALGCSTQEWGKKLEWGILRLKWVWWN